jgi:hypothetical protein
MTHRFATGQNVTFLPDREQDRTARGSYTVVRPLPPLGATPQYRVKAKIDGRERVVREDQLAGL